MNNQKKILIVGAGPAGLTAGYILAENGYKVEIIEQNSKYVGGISRTEEFKGFRFDIGGHRFFSKSKEINLLWEKILPKNFRTRDRKSRIYFNKNFFNYPLDLTEVIFKLGIVESIICFSSFLKAKIFPIKKPKSYHDWIYNNFGERLYLNFFKSYTEKVWGLSCDDISADWAAQRIKGLNFKEIIFQSIKKIFFKKNKKKIIKTLINQFKYPDYGPGMMWEAARDKIIDNGSKIEMAVKAIKYLYNKTEKKWHVTIQNKNNDEKVIISDIVICSAPMRDVGMAIYPQLKCLEDVKKLNYRDYITVAVLIDQKKIIDDNWIYIHEEKVKAGRIQNYTAWSSLMAPSTEKSCLGLEYFCNKNDKLWNNSDSDLKKIALEDLKLLKLIDTNRIIDFFVVRQEKAYPVYDDNYRDIVEKVSNEIENDYNNFYLVGRNGMHKYNNQDHSMMTSILTVENIIYNKTYNRWNVNEDAQYHESDNISKERALTLDSLRFVPKTKN